MRVSSLQSSLCTTAVQVAEALAESDQCYLSEEEYYDLTMTPAERSAYNFLKPRMLQVYIYDAHTINFGAATPIRCHPQRGIEMRISPADCSHSHTANPDLVTRILAWHERRLTLGFIASAFRDYSVEVLKAAPTMAHAYRVFPGIMTVFTRCAYVSEGMRREAMRVKTRELYYPPSAYQGLAGTAAEAAALIELMPEKRDNRPPEGGFTLRLTTNEHNRFYPARAVGEGVTLNPI